uniref:EGF-like domain-containing protein n=2 Tax=Strongyloides stercoralis TaxID=6248 RepID=A0AAF5DRG4_STRER
MLSNNYNILIFINLFIIFKISHSQWLSIISFKSRFSLPCVNNTFHCGDGKCIPINKIHDTYNDCSDGSDEYCFESKIVPKFCPYLKQKLCNANGTFHCKGYGECIFTEWMFDKKQDCYDGSDLDPEYVSIFKKILNNQYPEELLYHLKNNEKTNPSTSNLTNNFNNYSSIPFLWSNNGIIQQNKKNITSFKSKIPYSNKKPIQPVEGLELMSKTTIDKAPLIFPTLIPYQVTKSQNDFTKQTLTSSNIKSATHRTTLFPVIYSFTPLNVHINGHLQTTKGTNFFNIPNINDNKVDKEILEKNLHIFGTTKKNISLNNHLGTLKENITTLVDAFIEKATKQTNESHNYPKIVLPIDKISKEHINTTNNNNDIYLNNIFGDEKLITDQDKTFQSSFPFKEEKFEKEKIPSKNNNNTQSTTQKYLKLNEIENKEVTSNSLTKTIQSQENNLSDKLIKNNNLYTLTTKLDTKNNFLIFNKGITKTIYQTTDKTTTINNINIKENIYTLTTKKEITTESSQTTDIDINETLPQNIINNNKYENHVTTQQPKTLINNKNDVTFSTYKPLINSNNFEDKFDYSKLNNMGKQVNIPQSWNFFGIPQTEIAKNFYSVEEFLTQSTKPTFPQKTFEMIKEIESVNNDYPTMTKITTMNMKKTTITTPLIINIPESEVKSTTEKKPFENINKETLLEENKYSSNTITTPSNLINLKNISLENNKTETALEILTKNNMTSEEYNNCIKKFINDNFYHYDINSESTCECPPGDSSGFLGVCQHNFYSIILKLNIEKICGNIPSTDVVKKIKSGIVSLLKNENNIEDACFRITKTNDFIAEIFCKNCSLSSVGELFENVNMKNKYNSNFYFTPGGNDACNDSQLNFCDKNATCIPMNDKYECICESNHKNFSELTKFNTDYGRNCHNNNQCDTLFGICIIYWLLLIPFLLLILSCIYCLLYRICLKYNIHCCNNDKIRNLIPFYIKNKDRRKSRNVIIEDIKEAQKWHPQNTRPSSIHSTDDYQINSRRKSAIILSEDEYASKKSIKSQTNSIHSVEDYMITDDETEYPKDIITPIVKTQAEIHNEPENKLETININDNKIIQSNLTGLQRHQSQPIFEEVHQTPNFSSLTDIKNIVSNNQLLNQKNVPILSKSLSKSNIIENNTNNNKEVYNTVQTIHSSLENISSHHNIKTNKVNSETNLKMLSEKTMYSNEIFPIENAPFDGDRQSIKCGKSSHSKNSSSSLLSNHPIIEEEEDERNDNMIMNKIIDQEKPLDDTFINEKLNNSVKSLPYINNNSPNLSMTNISRHSIPTIENKQKYFFQKRNASSATLWKHTENDNNFINTNLSLKANSSSIEPLTKDITFNSIHEISTESSYKKDTETIWEHYKHDTELPNVVQTDSMNELERLFCERLKYSLQIEDTDSTNIPQTINVENLNKIQEQKNEFLDVKNEIVNVENNSNNLNDILKNEEKNIIKDVDVKVAEAEKIENMLEDITKISDYNFKEDNTFMNIVTNDSDKTIYDDNDNFNKHDTLIKNVSNKKLEKNCNDFPNINDESKHTKPIENTTEQNIFNLEKDKKKQIENKITITPKTTIKISKPSIIDKTKLVSHSISKNEKNSKKLDIKVVEKNKNLDISKPKRISLKPPIPKFPNLKLPSSSLIVNGPQSSRSVQERKVITTSPIARSSSFNLNKSSITKTSLNIKPSEIKIENQIPVCVKVKLPKIDELNNNKFDKEKIIKNNKKMKLPLLNKESELLSNIEDYNKNKHIYKMNPTSSNIIKKRNEEMNDDILNKNNHSLIQTKEDTLNKLVDENKYNELRSLKNIIPEKNTINNNIEKRGISNIKVTIKKKGKIVNEDDELCGACKHNIIQILPYNKNKEQNKNNKINNIIKQKKKSDILVENPKIHQLSVIKEKSEEYKNVKIKEPLKIDKNIYDFEENLPIQKISNFEISRENSLIPIHFDSRYVGPPSARESKRILEVEGNYYAGDVDLDMPSPYILPITESDIKNCIFNNNELKKLRTNLPFYDWDRHSEIVKKENLTKQKLNHSMSESNLEKKFNINKNTKEKQIYDNFEKVDIITRKIKSRSHSPSIFNKNTYENKNYINIKNNVTSHNNNLIYREKSNLSSTSFGKDERWNLAYLHEGDIEKIPFPPLSYSYRALNSKKKYK